MLYLPTVPISFHFGSSICCWPHQTWLAGGLSSRRLCRRTSSSPSTVGRSVLLLVLGLHARHTGAAGGGRASFGCGVSCLPRLGCARGLALTTFGDRALCCLCTSQWLSSVEERAHEVGGRAGGCFQEAGEHLAQPSAAESLKVFSLYSSFHRMRLTGEERSTTSTCPASSSTSTMVTS